jgi:hypothetical protein
VINTAWNRSFFAACMLARNGCYLPSMPPQHGGLPGKHASHGCHGVPAAADSRRRLNGAAPQAVLALAPMTMEAEVTSPEPAVPALRPPVLSFHSVNLIAA